MRTRPVTARRGSRRGASEAVDHALEALRYGLHGELAGVTRTEAELAEMRWWVAGG
jgi:hypothetical protein